MARDCKQNSSAAELYVSASSLRFYALDVERSGTLTLQEVEFLDDAWQHAMLEVRGFQQE